MMRMLMWGCILNDEVVLTYGVSNLGSRTSTLTSICQTVDTQPASWAMLGSRTNAPRSKSTGMR